MLYAATDMPGWGDGSSPASTHVSPEYIETAVARTHTPNFVTAVIADFRAFDTLLETAVIFTAGVACAAILAGVRRRAVR
jgi:multicomponent Na+:H+ antiporter subunit B